MKRTYRTELKSMNKEQLKEWIDEKTDMMLNIGDTDASTPLLTKIVYAKKLLSKL